MACKGNQEALYWICSYCSDYDNCNSRKGKGCIVRNILQQAIDDLEVYKKAFNDILDSMEQEKIICLYHGCPKQVEDDNFECIGTCPTRQEITDYFLNLARKELNENATE